MERIVQKHWGIWYPSVQTSDLCLQPTPFPPPLHLSPSPFLSIFSTSVLRFSPSPFLPLHLSLLSPLLPLPLLSSPVFPPPLPLPLHLSLLFSPLPSPSFPPLLFSPLPSPYLSTFPSPPPIFPSSPLLFSPSPLLTSPSFPSHLSLLLMVGSCAFFTGAVEPRPTANSLQR